MRPTARQISFAASLYSDYMDALGTPASGADLARYRDLLADSTSTAVSRTITTNLEGIKALRAAGKSKLATTKDSDPKVKAGRYLVDGQFVKVDTPTEGKWAGYVFVNELDENGKKTGSIRDREIRKVILNKIAADPKGMAVAYGQRTGTCGVCARTLTKATSIEAGIGPICAGGF